MMTLKDLHRRTFLRGVLQGSAVVVALPLLDVFLDPHGESVAKPLPYSPPMPPPRDGAVARAASSMAVPTDGLPMRKLPKFGLGCGGVSSACWELSCVGCD